MPRTTQDMLDLGYTLDKTVRLGLDGENVTELLTGPDGVQVVSHNGVVADEEFATVNQRLLRDKLGQARDYFAGNYADWPSMTNAQKDAANRQAQRALANLCRYVLRDLSSSGD